MTVYRITPASTGAPAIAGRVHGNGGMLTGEDGLGKLRFFASTGKFGGFQPIPGHVRVYPEWSAAEDGPSVDVPIINAAVQMVEEHPACARKSCWHSFDRHQTAGGFCKHCGCQVYLEMAQQPECTCDPHDGFGLLGGGWDPACERHGKHLEGPR